MYYSVIVLISLFISVSWMGISLSGSSGNSLHVSASRWRPSSVRSSSEQGEKMRSVLSVISEQFECCIWLVCLSAVTGTSSWASPNVAGTCCPTLVTAERMMTSPSTRITCTGGSSTCTAASNRYIYICSYFNHRSFSVCVDGCSSSKSVLICGVPQGSVLAPILFSLFAPVGFNF